MFGDLEKKKVSPKKIEKKNFLYTYYIIKIQIFKYECDTIWKVISSPLFWYQI